MIDIGYLLFPTSLIALESTDIDIILGMDWLSQYKANIDCAAKSVTLVHPSGETVRVLVSIFSTSFSRLLPGAKLFSLEVKFPS